MNGWSDEQLPTLVHGDIEKPDLAALGQYITALAGAGAPLFPDEKLDQYLREAGSLPINDEVGEQQSDDQDGPPTPTIPGDQEGEKGSTGLTPEDFYGA
jgi:hypothetical protein